MIKSPNFSFLSAYDPLLVDLAAAAERYCFADPVAALSRLRLLGETMALQTAAAVAALPNRERVVDFSTAIRLLEDKHAMSRETAQVFHHLRAAGNRAVHENAGSITPPRRQNISKRISKPSPTHCACSTIRIGRPKHWLKITATHSPRSAPTSAKILERELPHFRQTKPHAAAEDRARSSQYAQTAVNES